MIDFQLTRGDLLPVIAGEATGVDSLEGATAEFWFWPANDPESVTQRAAVIEGDGSTKMVRYDWQAGDTDVAGEYRGQFKITTLDDKILSIPNGRTLEWVVL